MITSEENKATLAPATVEIILPGFRPPGAEDPPRPDTAETPARLPRVARLMALAIKYQELVSRGELWGYCDIASLGYITRARATQIMNLLHLAPDIQEHLLFLDGRAESITERDLRTIAAAVYWKEQLQLWRKAGGSPLERPQHPGFRTSARIRYE